MLIYCFSETCCYWSPCLGLLQNFLEIVLTVLRSWWIHGQGLHSPKETEESWVMMARTFCCLDGGLSNLCGPCHSEDQKMKKAVYYCRGQPFPPPTLLRETLVHLQPTPTVLGNPGSQQMLCHHVFCPPECNNKAGLASPPYKPHCSHTYITQRLRSQLK